MGPSRLVLEKNILDLVYIHPGGVRTAMHLFFFCKSAIMKHPSADYFREHICTKWGKPFVLLSFGIFSLPTAQTYVDSNLIVYQAELYSTSDVCIGVGNLSQVSLFQTKGR